MEEKVVEFVDVAGQVCRVKPTFYEEWQEKEGIPVVKGYSVEDINTLPLKPWERKGGLGTFINMRGAEMANDCYVCEIPPGASLKPQKHLYEEWIYITKGMGGTTIWSEGGAKHTFEWQEGSLFSPPLNTWHQHFNGQGDVPARYVATTMAPPTLNMYRNLDFVFKNDFMFKERYDGQTDYFSEKGKFIPGRTGTLNVWESNLVPDVRKLELKEYKGEGEGFKLTYVPMSGNFVIAHVAEFEIGSYKNAHRHGPGAHIIFLKGEGYSLIWKEGQPRMRINWKPGCLLVPPENWFHQHFNTGKYPASYLALRRGGDKLMKDKYRSTLSISKGGDCIDYYEEDPEIGRVFLEELAKNGVKSSMTHLKGRKP